MSGPPPGYNPGESMFQGGSSAAIHPVMGGGGVGGGGALPAGFEQQSLLRGGESAAIHPVQGGGAGASTPFQIADELLTIPAKRADGTSDLPPEFDKRLEASVAEMPTLTESYVVKQRDGAWRRSNPKDPGNVERPRILTRGNCAPPTSGRLDDEKGEAGFDRLAVILPKSTAEIIVFPPVRSSRRTFYACLQYLQTVGLMNAEGAMAGPAVDSASVGQDTKVVLFAPPFLELDAKNVPGYRASNRKLFAHFLKLKAQYPHMHILTQSTAMNKMIGNCMIEGDKVSDGPLIHMLEPTYVIYPLVRVEEQANAVKIPRGGMIFSAAATNEVTLPASNLPSRLASPGVYIQKGGVGSVAYKPNPTVKDVPINKLYGAKEFRFYGEGADGKPGIVRRITVQASPAAVAAGAVNEDIFQATPEEELALDSVTYVRVPLDGHIFSFRNPGSPSVVNDWEGMRFTEDEAHFLNQLQLRPSLLPLIFKPSTPSEPMPPKRLAAFLRNMANGRCFTDERLLTHSECQESRDFVNQVYNYYLMKDERMEQLKEAEAAARRRALRLQVETAEDRAAEAQEGAREAQADLIKQLQQIKDNAELLGINVERPKTDYERNPMDPKDGGPVRKPIKRGETIMPPTESSEKDGQYEVQVIVFKRKTGEYWVGSIDIQVDEGEDVSKKVEMMLKNENEKYPGYYIMQDFN